MERLLKFCHSLFLLVVVSCQNKNDYSKYSITEKKQMSIRYLENGEQNFYQGSPKNMELIEMSIQLDSNNAAAWRELSVPYLKRGLPHEWKPLFDKAVEIDPLAWQGWRGYLKLFFYRDYESAIDDFNATDTLTPNFIDYPQGMSVDYLRALAYSQLNKDTIALEYLTKYIDEVTVKSGEDWVDVYAFIHRAIILIKLQDYENAIIDLERHLKYYSSSSDGYYHLAYINFILDRSEIANTQIKLAKSLFQKGYYMHHPYVEHFGQIYLSDVDELESKILR